MPTIDEIERKLQELPLDHLLRRVDAEAAKVRDAGEQPEAAFAALTCDSIEELWRCLSYGDAEFAVREAIRYGQWRAEMKAAQLRAENARLKRSRRGLLRGRPAASIPDEWVQLYHEAPTKGRGQSHNSRCHYVAHKSNARNPSTGKPYSHRHIFDALKYLVPEFECSPSVQTIL
ncbi:MAG TPA: hypothetical protein VHX68_05515 [Planctomycetaceae bacterium]|nr:hypothetical protein [Planctomycetaceae bacterium]